MARSFGTADKQCSTCRHWSRLHLHADMGRCYSPDYDPDPEYGTKTLESDGCKHWQDATLLRRRDD